MGEQLWGFGPMRIQSELGHLAGLINILPKEKKTDGTSEFRISSTFAVAPHWRKGEQKNIGHHQAKGKNCRCERDRY